MTFWVPPRFTIGRHLLHEPRNAEPSSPLRISLPKSLDPTQHYQSRYPKSRLFGYLGRQLLHEPRDALGSAACGAAGRCPWSRVHSNATRIGARTCAESIGFSRRPNPLPPRQVPKKSTPRPDLCCIDRFLPVTQPITTKAGSQKVDFLTTSQIYHRTSSLA